MSTRPTPQNWTALAGLLIALLAASCAKKTDEDTVLATAGEHKITAAAFARSYPDLLLKTPVQVQDSKELRYSHVRTLATRYYLSLRAIEAELHLLPAFRKAFAAESTAVIIHGLYQKEIASRLQDIAEEDLQEAFLRMHKKLQVRHLISRSEEGIDSLYRQLQQGADFYDLAQQCFTDSTLKFSGGDLGIISWGDMDIDFENAAYNLKIGETSKPVATKFGWHIIKVENIHVNPIVRQQEYQTRRPTLENRMRHILLKNRADLAIKEMMEEKNVQMNTALIAHLELQRRKLENGGLVQFSDISEIPDNPLQNILEAHSNNVMATFNGGNWTVADVQRYLPSVSPVSIRQGMYAVVAMSLRNHFLLQRAKRQRVDRIPAVKNEIDEKRRHLLSAVFVALYADTCDFDESEIRMQYESMKKGAFIKDKKMTVLEILCDSEKQAYRVRTKIADEADFRRLAAQHTVRPGMKEKEGYLGVLYKDDLGELGNYCFAAPTGKVSGPFPVDGRYALVMVLDSEPIYHEYESVRDRIIERMNEQKREFVFQKFKGQYGFQPQVRLHEEEVDKL